MVILQFYRILASLWWRTLTCQVCKCNNEKHSDIPVWLFQHTVYILRREHRVESASPKNTPVEAFQLLCPLLSEFSMKTKTTSLLSDTFTNSHQQANYARHTHTHTHTEFGRCHLQWGLTPAGQHQRVCVLCVCALSLHKQVSPVTHPLCLIELELP